MGISDRKEREKQEMRELILRAAKEMFLSDGYEKTSIRKIADKIEYSPTTIYLYFKDKSEIFHALMEIGFSKMLVEFEKLPSGLDPVEKLEKLAHTYINFAFNNEEMYDLMFIMRPPMEKVHETMDWDCGMRSFMFLKDVVRECIEKDTIKLKDPESASLLLWSEVHGLVSLYIRERMIMFPKEKVIELVNAAIDLNLKLIKK
jgi:AcrR family transcriptional regulator